MIEQTHIVLGMIFGFLAMMLMAGFIVAFIVLYQRRQINQEKHLNEVQRDYQKSLLETALDSEEAERRRMAGELHDDIGVMLSLTKMSVNQLQQKLGSREDERQMILTVKGLLEETMSNVRRISKALIPSTLEQFGLEAAIEDLVAKLPDSGVPKVVFFSEANETIPRQSRKTELALFRVVQELINNAVKHSGASGVKIELYSASGSIQLVVEDDGNGFDAAHMRRSKVAGLGLKNIESRLSIIGGTVLYSDRKPGTRVKIEVPLV